MSALDHTWNERKILAAGSILLTAAFVGCDGKHRKGPIIAEVEAHEWLPGGDTTNTLLFGSNAFVRPAENITDEHELQFYSGNSFFNQAWVQAPASTENRDGLGPLFNARSCSACHFKDGRGRPPLEAGEDFLGLLLRLSIPGTTETGDALPEPTYGHQFQPFAINGIEAEGKALVEYTETSFTYTDGTEYSLLFPTYSLEELAYGPLHEDVMVSPRVAQAVIGLGLLGSIKESEILANADPFDADEDGISGRINLVWDELNQEMTLGRFGWKAEQPTVEQQAAAAFNGDIGITTSIFPIDECSDNQLDCQDAVSGGDPEIRDELVEKVVTYARLLAVPMRKKHGNSTVLRGKWLFQQSGCDDCHIARYQTGTSDLEELENQEIWPYTDLLLHDMGEDLADNRPSFDATGSEWRTPPLWGIGRYPAVNGHDRLLHDGRARGVAEAILWHGGEAETSRETFRGMPASDRAALIEFVESL